MMTTEENLEALRSIKRALIRAHDDIAIVADIMEAILRTEKELADSKVYGKVCRALGILEEEIADTSNEITKLKQYETH